MRSHKQPIAAMNNSDKAIANNCKHSTPPPPSSSSASISTNKENNGALSSSFLQSSRPPLLPNHCNNTLPTPKNNIKIPLKSCLSSSKSQKNKLSSTNKKLRFHQLKSAVEYNNDVPTYRSLTPLPARDIDVSFVHVAMEEDEEEDEVMRLETKENNAILAEWDDYWINDNEEKANSSPIISSSKNNLRSQHSRRKRRESGSFGYANNNSKRRISLIEAQEELDKRLKEQQEQYELEKNVTSYIDDDCNSRNIEKFVQRLYDDPSYDLLSNEKQEGDERVWQMCCDVLCNDHNYNDFRTSRQRRIISTNLDSPSLPSKSYYINALNILLYLLDDHDHDNILDILISSSTGHDFMIHQMESLYRAVEMLKAPIDDYDDYDGDSGNENPEEEFDIYTYANDQVHLALQLYQQQNNTDTPINAKSMANITKKIVSMVDYELLEFEVTFIEEMLCSISLLSHNLESLLSSSFLQTYTNEQNNEDDVIFWRKDCKGGKHNQLKLEDEMQLINYVQEETLLMLREDYTTKKQALELQKYRLQAVQDANEVLHKQSQFIFMGKFLNNFHLHDIRMDYVQIGIPHQNLRTDIQWKIQHYNNLENDDTDVAVSLVRAPIVVINEGTTNVENSVDDSSNISSFRRLLLRTDDNVKNNWVAMAGHGLDQVDCKFRDDIMSCLSIANRMDLAVMDISDSLLCHNNDRTRDKQSRIFWRTEAVGSNCTFHVVLRIQNDCGMELLIRLTYDSNDQRSVHYSLPSQVIVEKAVKRETRSESRCEIVMNTDTLSSKINNMIRISTLRIMEKLVMLVDEFLQGAYSS